MVYNLALRITRDADDAAVTLQETFLKVFSALPRFRGGSRLETWIYRIAVNEALQRIRNRPQEESLVDLESIETHDFGRDYHAAASMMAGDPQAMLESRELSERLEAAIGELPPKHRVAFVLVDLEGLPLRDAARAAGASVAALKTNLHRARLFLRDRLADYLEGRTGSTPEGKTFGG